MCCQDILDRLGTAGPLSSRELPDTCVAPWASAGWTNNRNVKQLLEFVVKRGDQRSNVQVLFWAIAVCRL